MGILYSNKTAFQKKTGWGQIWLVGHNLPIPDLGPFQNQLENPVSSEKLLFIKANMFLLLHNTFVVTIEI